MKKLLLATVLGLGLIATTAHADWHGGYRGGYHPGYYHGGCYGCGNWVAPAIIGGVIGYELSRPSTVVVEQPSVVYTQPQTVIQQPPVGYHWQEMIDPQTNTRKIVLVPNQ
jgi:hypothetical protein